MNKTNIRMQRDIFRGSIQVQLVDNKNGNIYVAQPVEFKELPESHYAPPFLELNVTDAQQFMDELWHCGIRPSEGTGSSGSLAATERHLKDMQKIAFKLLKLE